MPLEWGSVGGEARDLSRRERGVIQGDRKLHFVTHRNEHAKSAGSTIVEKGVLVNV
jgi:hypothetical protein